MRSKWLLPVAIMLAASPALAADPALERNKRIVLNMWHEVINGHNLAAAPKYIARDYIQHSPSAPSGRAALVEFLKKEFHNAPPLRPGTYPLTRFEFVIAEGNLVQLMFQRTIPNPHNPARTIKVWWYDTYRVKNGMIVEHWDSALE